MSAKYCIYCGKQMIDGANFCAFCGRKIDFISASTTPIQQIQYNNQRQQEFIGKIFKCPNCGEVINQTTVQYTRRQTVKDIGSL